MMSVRNVLDERRGVGPGFGILRHALSLMILIEHCYIIALGKSFNIGYQKNELLAQIHHYSGKQLLIESFRPFMFYLVGAFFALSGFLVFGSALRNRRLQDFLMLRVVRIVPALAVEVAISALIIGPLVTSWALADYFADKEFLAYFGNIVGFVHFNLPGVFKTNPTPNWVNANLWTLPPELECYSLLAVLILLGIARNRWAVAAVVAVASMAILTLAHYGLFELHGSNVAYSPRYIVYLFLLGVAGYVFADVIPIHFGLFAACLALFYVGGVFHVSDIFFAPCLVYTVVYIGCLDLSRFDRWIGGDYSYGIYLYGYPLTQTVMFYLKGPLERLAPAVEVAALATIAVPLTCLVAFLSWHLVERRCLKLKRYLTERPPAESAPAAGLAPPQEKPQVVS